MIIFRSEAVRIRFHLLSPEVQSELQTMATRLLAKGQVCELDFVSQTENKGSYEISITIKEPQ